MLTHRRAAESAEETQRKANAADSSFSFLSSAHPLRSLRLGGERL